MTQVLAATTGLFRDRDLFIHDGSKLRRFRISAPLQAVFFIALLMLVGWASYATARLVAGPHAIARMNLPAPTRAPPPPVRAPPGGHRGGARRQEDRSEDDRRRSRRPPRQGRPARP